MVTMEKLNEKTLLDSLTIQSEIHVTPLVGSLSWLSLVLSALVNGARWLSDWARSRGSCTTNLHTANGHNINLFPCFCNVGFNLWTIKFRVFKSDNHVGMHLHKKIWACANFGFLKCNYILKQNKGFYALFPFFGDFGQCLCAQLSNQINLPV